MDPEVSGLQHGLFHPVWVGLEKGRKNSWEDAMASTTREQRQDPRQSRSDRSSQARQAARDAREKAEKRRQKQTGAAGWIAARASQWTLDGPDWDFFEQQKYFWNPLMDYWFRMEIEGWEHLPPPPALLIGIHSGAPFVWDAWTIGVQWWRYFGRSRPLHAKAHDLRMRLP